jgi:ketosteroid isomerase-like protein
MTSAELSRRVETALGFPPLSEIGADQRRELEEALLASDTFEDLPGKWQAAVLAAEQADRPNVERLRAALDALRADSSELDWEATLAGAWVELWDPDIEWDASTHPLPDLAGVYRGTDATLGWWRQWLAAWEAVRVDYELVEAGERVVGLFHQRMRGAYTGIDVGSGKYAMVFTFRDGLLVHAKFYASQSEALEAVGLRDQAY